jgi:ABC-type multidrug transport system fused ATPase/permease subunit
MIIQIIGKNTLKENQKISWIHRVVDLGLSYRVIAILILLSLVSTITEIFSIGIFLPIFQFISHKGDIDTLLVDSTLWRYLVDVFDFFGINLKFLYLLLLSFGFFLSRQIFLYVRLIYTAAVRQRLVQKLRNRVFNKYIEASSSYHDSVPVGDLVNVITTEVNKAVLGFLAPIELIVYFIMLFSYLTLLAFLSWKMTLLSAIILLLAIRIPKTWIKKSAGVGRKLVSANTLVSEFLVGRLRSPRLVRLSGTEVAEKNEFKQLTRGQRKNAVLASILQAKTDVIMEPVVVGISLIFLYFSYTVLKMQVETIGIFLVIVLRILPIVRGLIAQWQKVQSILGSIEIIENRIQSMNDSVENDTGIEKICKFNQSIEIINVSYCYSSTDDYALNEINIRFNSNEMTAITGPSGSGKSTLIDLLPRLRVPTKGVIKVDGINIENYSLKSLRNIISYAPQSPQIFDGTVKDHILYGKLDATENEIQEAINLAGAENFIDKLPQGLDTFLGEDAIKLSGGQRQRLDLARVLIKKSPILILDEPTSNLDAESENLFKQILYRIQKETDTTIIVVSHRLASIADSDKIIVLNQGKVESYGTNQELLDQNGWYAKAWKMQA